MNGDGFPDLATANFVDLTPKEKMNIGGVQLIHSICGFLSSGQMPLPRGVQIALSLVVMMTALAVGPTALAQPTAQPDSFTVQEDSSGSSFDVLANDSTPDTRTSVSVTTPN